MAPATIDFAGVHIWPDLWTVSLTLLPVNIQLWLHLQWGVFGMQLLQKHSRHRGVAAQLS